MKKTMRSTAIICIAFACLSVVVSAGAAPLRVTLTFDDAAKDHYLVAAPALEKHGWRGTFCLVTDWLGTNANQLTWAEAADLVRRGHELASHTRAHRAIGKMLEYGLTNDVHRQLAESRDLIAEKTGFAPRYFCPPFVNQDAVTAAIVREEGMEQMLDCRELFGGGQEGKTREIVERAIAAGKQRMDVLHHGIYEGGNGGWRPFATREDFLRHLDVLAELEREGKIVITDYDGFVSDCALKAKAWPRHGVLALSFDDRNFGDWERALPLFEKHHARATFFVSGAIDAGVVGFMKKALAAGCEPALHGHGHRNADVEVEKEGAEKYWAKELEPQLAACRAAGVPIRSFAYPNCARTEASDAVFFAHGFTRLRGSLVRGRNPNPFSPKGKPAGWRPVATCDAMFRPAADYLSLKVIDNVIMGDAYHTDIDDILAAIARAGERGEVLSLLSHGIGPNATFINMKSAWLERMLSGAAEKGVVVRGVR